MIRQWSMQMADRGRHHDWAVADMWHWQVTFLSGGAHSSKFGGGLPKCRAANQHGLAGERVSDGVGSK